MAKEADARIRAERGELEDIPFHDDNVSCPKCNSHSIIGYGNSSNLELNTCLNCGYEWYYEYPEIENEDEN
jgi:predicted nucleic-acid-binding Zn-ribbon protein